SFNLLPMFSALDNITMPSRIAGSKADRGWINTLTDTLGLGDRLHHKPYELSGGQQQRVAIARALSTKPEVVFADEPTGNLDSRSGVEVLALLRQAVRELGQTVIMVTHDPAAAAHASEVVLIADGKVAGRITDPTPESVLAGLDALRAGETVAVCCRSPSNRCAAAGSGSSPRASRSRWAPGSSQPPCSAAKR